MNITQERTDDLNGVIKIHLEPNDYREGVKEELRNYARKANIPGFRPGKVPLSLIKKMVGVSVVMDTVSKALQEGLQGYIEKEELELLGEPLATEKKDEEYFDIDCNKDLEFSFQVGLAPKFELDLEFKKPIDKYTVEIDDEFLNKHIEGLQDRYAEFDNPEVAKEGDIIFGKLAEADDEGNVVEGGFEKMVALNPKRIDSKAVFKPFKGKKIDDTVPFKLKDLAKDDEEKKKILMLEDEDLANIKDKNLVFTVMRISRIILAELNEEFFKKVLGENTEITDEAAFREDQKSAMQKQVSSEADNRYRWEIRKALEAKHPMELPVEFLKKWMQESNEKITEENVDKEYDNLSESLQWSLVAEKIRKAHPETELKPDEVEKEIEASLRQTLGQELSDEDMKQYTTYIMRNEEMFKQHYYRIMDEKLFAVLEDLVKAKSKKITATAFAELEKP